MCYSQFFFTKLLTLVVFISAAFRAVLLPKLVILGISPLILFVLALRVGLVTRFVVSGILSSFFFILALYTSF